MKWIALDIDGTITDQMHSIPKRVVSYLKNLQNRGWRIIVLTGRPYAFCVKALSTFDFPYIFSSQNGSFAWNMPGRKEIFKSHIKREILEVIEKGLKDLDVLMMERQYIVSCVVVDKTCIKIQPHIYPFLTTTKSASIPQ